MRIAVIGGGGWGLALTKLMAEQGHEPIVWEHNPAFLAELQSSHSNFKLLPNIVLDDRVRFTGDIGDIERSQPEIIILATPAQFIRSTLSAFNTEIGNSLWISPELKAVVNVAKGIEENTLLTIDKILFELLPPEVHAKVCALSGPSHAEEVSRGIPTTVVIAGSDDALLKELQAVFSNAYFRVYRSSDLIGVEIGGAVKNIISIAAGIVSGLGFGDNTIGALLTRGIVEIQRYGLALGAKPETFLGLSGIGDLITTATSPHSRNRFVGFEIGKGRKLGEIIASMSMVAEGVATTRSVWQSAQKLGVEMPIVDQVYAVLYEDKDPKTAITDLMTRELKAE
ncbi:MAG: NAD(P)H-dependent glycerol-3-phosphate dehydrogenase [Candidatus Cloacimonadaceae bacterium]|nr:NAD(P)H-dependent glycerol-3-phosphate dehydrogenase [Actinomycetota bacterium]MDZ4182115.1 NAD(P)H-dependent glycerol-3-phosphate dehydrogenase [Candidatus Cloacimonadaceae bacterium]